MTGEKHKEEYKDPPEDDADAFGIIATAGEARSDAFRALAAAREGDFLQADALLAESDEHLRQAHAVQTALLAREAAGQHVPVDVMLVHAQDHLMTSSLARELIAEIIDLRREVADGTRSGGWPLSAWAACPAP